MEQPTEIQVIGDLDKVIDQLLFYETTMFQHAKACFNGIWLYSDGLTEDEAYQKVYGMTREEWCKANIIELDVIPSFTCPYLDEVVKALENCEIYRRRHAKAKVNGHILYSEGITYDSAYQEIYGRTRDEHLAYVKEREAKSAEEKAKKLKALHEEALILAPELIEKGKRLIHEFKHELWENLINKIIKGNIEWIGIEIDALKVTIEVMEQLESGYSAEKCAEQYLSIRGVDSDSLAKIQYVMHYHDKGPDFVEAIYRIADIELTKANQAVLNKIRAANAAKRILR